ncbi:MAG TPA: 5-deoxy-glucuronate isomerase [Steroidobacteraceae bacterium]|nr:5-deoxy-glucuronate isomerase [Steroidobacteraceae bacterium]
MSLRVRSAPPDPEGRVLAITPESAGWKYVGFEVRRLTAGQRVDLTSARKETCVVVLTGTAHVQVGKRAFAGLGGRKTVFEDAPPGAVYAPAGSAIHIEGGSDCEIALCSAPGSGAGEPRAIPGERMPQEIRGEGANRRFVRNVLPETEPAERLLLVEVITPGGHWSSYPPHKHDTDTPPAETQLEETYYHRLDPPQGFAFQRVYTDDRSIDETVCVEDGDVVLVPRGYHPVGAPHGYDLYYLNVMAGPVRRWIARDDPAHAWIKGRR